MERLWRWRQNQFLMTLASKKRSPSEILALWCLCFENFNNRNTVSYFLPVVQDDGSKVSRMKPHLIKQFEFCVRHVRMCRYVDICLLKTTLRGWSPFKNNLTFNTLRASLWRSEQREQRFPPSLILLKKSKPIVKKRRRQALIPTNESWVILTACHGVLDQDP